MNKIRNKHVERIVWKSDDFIWAVEIKKSHTSRNHERCEYCITAVVDDGETVFIAQKI